MGKTSRNHLDDFLIWPAIGKLESNQSQAEVSRMLQVTRNGSPGFGINPKQKSGIGSRIPRQVCRVILQGLTNRNEIDPFLKRIMTGDEKWITYGNIARNRSWSKSGEAAQTVAKLGLTARKVLLCICDEVYFWLNGYVNKQNYRIWSETNLQVYVETPLHPEKLTVWCALWAGGIIGPYFFKND
ncbi:putative transposable element [Trichonephila clavipes]|nr:putative transposable element [Trichonephila clavipes]